MIGTLVRRIVDPKVFRGFSWIEGSFGQVVRVSESIKTGDCKWYEVHLFCDCMFIFKDLIPGGEVNWSVEEMIPLSDEEALALMDSHVCDRNQEAA